MRVTLYALVMVFGALVAGIGLVLLFRKQEQQSLSRIKIFGQEFQFSAPGLVVALAGCVLVVLLPVLGVTDKEVFTIGPSKVVGPDIIHPDVVTGTHHTFETAYPIKLGSSTNGMITASRDPDCFKLQIPGAQTAVTRVRVIVEKTFTASVSVYDNVEQSVAPDNIGEFADPVSFMFEGTPGAYYYIRVSSGGGSGEYTLIVKQEVNKSG